MSLMNYKPGDLIFNASGTYRITIVDKQTDSCIIVKQIWNPNREIYENETTRGELVRIPDLIKYAVPNASQHEKEKERSKIKFRKLVMK